MWIIKEAEDKITLIGIPVGGVVIGLFLVVTLILFVSGILRTILSGQMPELWILAVSITLIMIFGLFLLATASITITTIYETLEQFTRTWSFLRMLLKANSYILKYISFCMLNYKIFWQFLALS